MSVDRDPGRGVHLHLWDALMTSLIETTNCLCRLSFTQVKKIESDNRKRVSDGSKLSKLNDLLLPRVTSFRAKVKTYCIIYEANFVIPFSLFFLCVRCGTNELLTMGHGKLSPLTLYMDSQNYPEKLKVA